MKTGVALMTSEMRKSGIDVVGDMPWGTHICLSYETKEDLLDTLVSYCKAGLESQEFCLWVVAEPVREEEARHALKQVVPDLDRYRADHSIDIVSAGDWYLQGGTFDLKRVMSGWHERLALALARGYAGVRVTGDTRKEGLEGLLRIRRDAQRVYRQSAPGRAVHVPARRVRRCGNPGCGAYTPVCHRQATRELGNYRNPRAQASQGRNQADERGARTTCRGMDQLTDSCQRRAEK